MCYNVVNDNVVDNDVVDDDIVDGDVFEDDVVEDDVVDDDVVEDDVVDGGVGPNHNSQRAISILVKRDMDTEVETIFAGVDQTKATTHLNIMYV